MNLTTVTRCVVLLLAAYWGGWTMGAQDLSLPDLAQKVRDYHYGQPREALEAVERKIQHARAHPEERRLLARELTPILQSAAVYDAKQFVCRQLLAVAGEEEIPVLAGLVETADTPLAHMALYVLARIPGQKVNAALRDMLHSTKGSVQIAVINTLGGRGDEKSALPLVGLLNTSGDASLITATVAALGKIGNLPAFDALKNAYPASRGPMRLEFADALLKASQNLVAHGAVTDAIDAFKLLYADRQLPQIQAAALPALTILLKTEALPLLLDAMKQEGTHCQRMAADLARQLPGEEATKEFAQWLPQLLSDGQILLLLALADRGDKAALPAVGELCASTNSRVRLAALEALASLGDGSVLLRLATRAAAGTAEEQATARRSLVRLSGTNINSSCLQALDQTQPSIKVELIQALGKRRATESVNQLMGRLRDPDQSVQIAVWQALRELCGMADLSPLLERFVEAPVPTINEAQKTLASVIRQLNDPDQAALLLARPLAANTSVSVKTALIELLRQTGGAKSLSLLLPLAQADISEVESAALRAIGEWPTDAPMNDLRQIAANATDPRRRLVALRGFVRLIGFEENRPSDEALALYQKALSLAGTTEEKQVVLSGLGSLKTPAALDIAVANLKVDTLRATAEGVVLAIARDIGGACREPTQIALGQVLSITSSDAVRKQAAERLAIMESFGDYITAWEVSPAYTQDDAMAQWLLDTPFAPEIPDQAPRVPWKIMPAGTDPAKPWLLDLLAYHGGETRVTYLRTRVRVDAAQTLVLELGSDDGIKAWLNGKVIVNSNVFRPIEPALEKITVHLDAGWNSLLLKINQNNMGWGACARFRSTDGSPVPGVRCAVP